MCYLFFNVHNDFQFFGSEKRSLPRAVKLCFCSENSIYLHEKLQSRAAERISGSDMVLAWGKGVSFFKPQLPHTHIYIHTDNVKCSTYLLGLIENVMSGYTQ